MKFPWSKPTTKLLFSGRPSSALDVSNEPIYQSTLKSTVQKSTDALCQTKASVDSNDLIKIENSSDHSIENEFSSLDSTKAKRGSLDLPHLNRLALSKQHGSAVEFEDNQQGSGLYLTPRPHENGEEAPYEKLGTTIPKEMLRKPEGILRRASLTPQPVGLPEFSKSSFSKRYLSRRVALPKSESRLLRDSSVFMGNFLSIKDIAN